MTRTTLCISLVLVLALPACDEPETDESTDQARAAAESESEDEQTAADSSNEEETGDDPRKQRADEADRQLRQTLLGRVMEVSKQEGFAAAVDVCHDEAIPLTEEVGEEYGVEIGRVSDRLRNPDNTGPDWVDPMIEEAGGEAHYTSDDERLRAVKPLRIAEPCTNCHGETDQLADGVAEKLEEHYPEDQATGYETGDLRGWVWVEVPNEGG